MQRAFLSCIAAWFAAAVVAVAAAAAVAAVAAAAAATDRPAKPNIILVLTDDQGYGDLGCHGHPYVKTPNIDRLYAQSARLTDYHVSPTCAPTRAALMTGRVPFKNGVTHTRWKESPRKDSR
jgi:arylsulfatase